jgi:hypothetical protein
MKRTLETVLALEAMEVKLRLMLPEQYQDFFENVSAAPMGSAGLKYGADGLVAWDEMWATFCDLAMAGGPPHRGTLLEPASASEAAANPGKLRRVAAEICRGLALVTGLKVTPRAEPEHEGAVQLECHSAGMAGWLVRAIVMENVLARHEAGILILPAGPQFRLEKEIRNVITAVAKTCHYWMDHMPADQKNAVEALLANSADCRLLEPASIREIQAAPDVYRSVAGDICREISERCGNVCFPHRYAGWIGVECPDVQGAIWMMRAVVIENILARREDTVLFLPVHPEFAADGRASQLVQAFEHAYRLYEAAFHRNGSA